MIVKTPAMRLGVEIRDARLEDERISFSGVANAMPCTVEMTPHEMLMLSKFALRPAILKRLIGALFRRSGAS